MPTVTEEQRREALEVLLAHEQTLTRASSESGITFTLEAPTPASEELVETRPEKIAASAKKLEDALKLLMPDHRGLRFTNRLLSSGRTVISATPSNSRKDDISASEAENAAGSLQLLIDEMVKIGIVIPGSDRGSVVAV